MTNEEKEQLRMSTLPIYRRTQLILHAPGHITVHAITTIRDTAAIELLSQHLELIVSRAIHDAEIADNAAREIIDASIPPITLP